MSPEQRVKELADSEQEMWRGTEASPEAARTYPPPVATAHPHKLIVPPDWATARRPDLSDPKAEAPPGARGALSFCVR